MSARPAKAAEIAKEFGFTSRYWIKLAAAGKIPGARQPSGPGGSWVFDMREFRLWWASREPIPTRKDMVGPHSKRRQGIPEVARNAI
jgi:hypothetical protein